MHHDVSTSSLLATWRAIFQRADTRLSGVLACQNLYRIRCTCIWRYTRVCVSTPYCVIEHQNLHSRYTRSTQSGSLRTLSAAFIQLVGYSSPCDALLCGYPLAIFVSRILLTSSLFSFLKMIPFQWPYARTPWWSIEIVVTLRVTAMFWIYGRCNVAAVPMHIAHDTFSMCPAMRK